MGENLNKACGPQAFSVSSLLQVGGEGAAHGALLEQLLIGAASEMKEDSDLSRWRVRWRPVCDIFEGRVYLPSQTLCPDLLRPMLDHQFYGSLESNRAGLPQGRLHSPQMQGLIYPLIMCPCVLKGTIGDEMVGWHHWLSGHGLGQTLGDTEGQGDLAYCSSWDCKESGTT